MNVKDKIAKLNKKCDLSPEEIALFSGAKHVSYVQRIIKNEKISLAKKIWKSVAFWRVIAMFIGIISISVSVILFAYPHDSFKVLERLGAKSPHHANLKITALPGDKVPDFMSALEISNVSGIAFNILALDENTVPVENIQFNFHSKKFGDDTDTGIVYVQNIHMPRAAHAQSENLRQVNSIPRHRVKIFQEVDPFNLNTKYSTIIGDKIVGAETIDIYVDFLNPRDQIAFVIYVIPGYHITNGKIQSNKISLRDFWWDVCYTYDEYGKQVKRCITNSSTKTYSGGRSINSRIIATADW